MKRLILQIILTFSWLTSFGQLTQEISLESGFNCFIPISSSTNGKIDINYGGSVFLFNRIGKVNIGLGISPATNNFESETYKIIDGNNELVTNHFTSNITYFSLQIIAFVKEQPNWNVNFTFGLTIAKVYNEKVESFLQNGEPYNSGSQLNSLNPYPYLNVGVNVVKHINTNWGIVFRPTILATTIDVPAPTHYPSISYPTETLKWNLSLGVNYSIATKTLKKK